MPPHKQTEAPRVRRRSIADETLKAIEAGSYFANGATYDLTQKTEESKGRTQFYGADSSLSAWKTLSPTMPSSQTTISFSEISTLEGARYLTTQAPDDRIGILNFASAKKPGGGFLTGSQAQEESIARSSNLYPTLLTPMAQQYYTLHKAFPKEGFYSHSMIYSPDIVVFRNDKGDWVKPLQVDVLTSPAVNAGLVRRALAGRAEPAEIEDRIADAMRERMGRILYLFEKEGVKNIVLGSFGTGVFKNKVNLVGRIWAEYLSAPDARFQHSFDRVVFAILGSDTFREFKASYQSVAPQVGDAASSA
ncbi:hypothetical protein AX17_006116 [Amanita inopinata Kibby_2008]|nr:hypothetical protein AX17_006116 [Amanita inopinata Kibby_2008]